MANEGRLPRLCRLVVPRNTTWDRRLDGGKMGGMDSPVCRLTRGGEGIPGFIRADEAGPAGREGQIKHEEGDEGVREEIPDGCLSATGEAISPAATGKDRRTMLARAARTNEAPPSVWAGGTEPRRAFCAFLLTAPLDSARRCAPGHARHPKATGAPRSDAHRSMFALRLPLPSAHFRSLESLQLAFVQAGVRVAVRAKMS